MAAPINRKGLIYRADGDYGLEAIPDIGRVTLSVICGDANRDKRFHRVRILNEKEQNFGVVFINPPLPTVDGNNSYGINASARRLIIQIRPEEADATINQMSLTYDVMGPDIKR